MSYQKGSEREQEVVADAEMEIRPPDSGWGWVVCFATFMTNFTIVAQLNGNGIVFTGLLDLFGESVSKTSLVGSIFGGLTMFGGPLVSALILYKASHRQIMMAGAITAAASTVASAFAPSIEVLILTYGILAGLSLATTYFSANVILACYFTKRRAIAVGIANSGSGIGSFVLVYLTEKSISFYGMRGTFLLIGGLFLNLTVCGMLCRPLKPVPKFSNNIPETSQISEDCSTPNEETETLVDERASHCRYSIDSTKASNCANLRSLYCDATIFRNKTFGYLLVIYSSWAVGESVLIYLPLYTQSVGMSREDVALIISIFGIISTIGPILVGLLADVLHIPTSYLLFSASFSMSLSIVAIPFCQTFATLTADVVILSIGFSFGISLRIVIVAEVLGIEKMTTAYSIMTMLVGIGYTVYPIISGIVYDATHSFPIIFYVDAAIAFLGAILSCGVIYDQHTGKFVL